LEKGIDVALAVDLVRMGVQGRYDVAIVMSADTDLRPALEAVVALREAGSTIEVEVAAWKTKRYHQRLSLLGGGAPQWPPCHSLDRSAYEAVQDKSKYLSAVVIDRKVEGGGTEEEINARRRRAGL
jgi:hypothetical protein